MNVTHWSLKQELLIFFETNAGLISQKSLREKTISEFEDTKIRYEY